MAVGREVLISYLLIPVQAMEFLNYMLLPSRAEFNCFINFEVVFFGSFSQHILKTYTCTKAKLQFDRSFPAHCDGEDIGFITDIEFIMNPGSLKVITKGNN